MNKTYEGDEVLIDEDGELLYFPKNLEKAIIDKLDELLEFKNDQ